MRSLLLLGLLPLSLSAASVGVGVAVWAENAPHIHLGCSASGISFAGAACDGASAWASASYNSYRQFVDAGNPPPETQYGRINVASNVEVHDVFTITGAPAGSSLRFLLDFEGQLTDSSLLWYRAYFGVLDAMCEGWAQGASAIASPFAMSCSLNMPLSGPVDTISFVLQTSLQTHSYGEGQFGEVTSGRITSIGVYSAAGQYLAGIPIAAESGHPYSSEVPEPGTALLLPLTLVIIAALRPHRAVPAPRRPA